MNHASLENRFLMTFRPPDIGDQLEHHRTLSYQDELRELFQAQGIKWDEQYVWD